MKYYTSTTEFNCGIDLHAHQMYVCVLDRQGKKLVHCNIKDNDFGKSNCSRPKTIPCAKSPSKTTWL